MQELSSERKNQNIKFSNWLNARGYNCIATDQEYKTENEYKLKFEPFGGMGLFDHSFLTNCYPVWGNEPETVDQLPEMVIIGEPYYIDFDRVKQFQEIGIVTTKLDTKQGFWNERTIPIALHLPNDPTVEAVNMIRRNCMGLTVAELCCLCPRKLNQSIPLIAYHDEYM